MNFSHGEYEYHQSVIDNTRKVVSREYFDMPFFLPGPHSLQVDPEGRPLAIALDTVSFLEIQSMPQTLTNIAERPRDPYWFDEE